MLFTLAYFSLYVHSSLLLENIELFWLLLDLNKLDHRSLFNYVIKLYCSLFNCVLWDYSSLRIGFNMISKRWLTLSHWLFLQKHSILDVWQVLNMLLNYLSCFVIILRGIHRNVDICQTDYKIPPKLEFPPHSEAIKGSATFK